MSSMDLSFLVWKKRKVSGESRRGRQSSASNGRLVVFSGKVRGREGWARTGRGPGCYGKASEAHAQPRRVTGLETWWGAAAMPSVPESGLPGWRGLQLQPPCPPLLPRTGRLLSSSPVISEGRTPHIRQTMDPAGPPGCPPSKVIVSFLPSFRPKAWINGISL